LSFPPPPPFPPPYGIEELGWGVKGVVFNRCPRNLSPFLPLFKAVGKIGETCGHLLFFSPGLMGVEDIDKAATPFIFFFPFFYAEEDGGKRGGHPLFFPLSFLARKGAACPFSFPFPFLFLALRGCLWRVSHSAECG